MEIANHADPEKLAWVVGILLAFAVTMLLLAIADRVSAGPGMKGHYRGVLSRGCFT